MMHPDTELRFVSKEVGFGVFAKAPIAMGTIIYVQDYLDQVIPEESLLYEVTEYRQLMDYWSYRKPNGDRVICWDHGKYMNHSCESNTLSTPYDFEIAIRDIREGEEITDDYGHMNIEYEMKCLCGSPNCRRLIQPSDVLTFPDFWDELLSGAYQNVVKVQQPLLKFADPSEIKFFIDDLLNNNLKSMRTLIYRNT